MSRRGLVEVMLISTHVPPLSARRLPHILAVEELTAILNGSSVTQGYTEAELSDTASLCGFLDTERCSNDV